MPTSRSGVWANPRHGTTTGYSNYGCRCGPCRAKNAERHRGWVSRHLARAQTKARLYYHAHPERRRPNTLRRYSVSSTIFDKMLEEQYGRCAICGHCPQGAVLQVDHDHRCCPGQKSCGRCVRGLLCGPCNRAIGLLNDDSGRAKRVVEYLDQYTPKGIVRVAD